MDSESSELPALKYENDSQTLSGTPLAQAIEQEGGVEAWCTVAGGYVVFLSLDKRQLGFDVLKLAGAFWDLWISIVFWGISRSLYSGADIILLQCQLDWIYATLPFCCHGFSCWTTPRQRIFQTCSFRRLSHLSFQVRSAHYDPFI